MFEHVSSFIRRSQVTLKVPLILTRAEFPNPLTKEECLLRHVETECVLHAVQRAIYAKHAVRALGVGLLDLDVWFL